MKTQAKYLFTLLILLLSGSSLLAFNKEYAAQPSSENVEPSHSPGVSQLIITNATSAFDEGLETFYIEEEEDEDDRDSLKKHLGGESDSFFVHSHIQEYFVRPVNARPFHEHFIHFSSLRSLNIEFSTFRI